MRTVDCWDTKTFPFPLQNWSRQTTFCKTKRSRDFADNQVCKSACQQAAQSDSEQTPKNIRFIPNPQTHQLTAESRHVLVSTTTQVFTTTDFSNRVFVWKTPQPQKQITHREKFRIHGFRNKSYDGSASHEVSSAAWFYVVPQLSHRQ